MPTKTAVQTVTWVEWDDKLRRFSHNVLRGPSGTMPAQTGEIPDHVVVALEKISADEIKNRTGTGAPRILDPEDYEAWVSHEVVRAGPENALSDDQINALKADDLMAQLNRNPALADRVLDLEQTRKYKRKPIISLAERLIALENGEDISLAGSADVPRHPPLTPPVA
jgi:hypothetical protein